MEIITNSCQVCGREIKAGKGLIAHHGYRRPEWGWQTASCMGARHLPYEESCDVLPAAIEKIKSYITHAEKTLADFLGSPPAEMTLPRKTFDNGRIVVVTIPENFNPEKIWSASYRSYEAEYQSRRYHMEQDIKYANINLVYMQERLTNWVKIR